MDFRYKAKASNGKTISGTQAANNEAELIAWMRDKGWVPIDISRTYEVALQIGESVIGKKDIDLHVPSFFSPRIKLRDKAVFFRQLATMISAGIPISASLEILTEQTSNKRFRHIISRIYFRVSSGATFGAAIAEHPKCFDPLVTALVRAGEESGTLDESLLKLAGFLEDQDVLRKKIISALTYPSVVMAIALIVLGVMVVVVIPQFQRAFQNLNVKMPILTQWTFALGTWARGNWYYIPAAIAAFAVAVYVLRKSKSLELIIDAAILKVPVFGDIIFKASVSRSFRTMSSLLRSGIPVLQSLEMAGNVALNSKIRNAFVQMRDTAVTGASMNSIMREKKLFPPMISHMIAVGEETGRTDEMFDKIADWYESELSEKIKRLSSILEPVMVVFVGIIVGFMVLAIFLPIISAIQAFM
ncbi:MAG: type II secretion system F family protein [Synergistaceae bacterium]|nr:type II secretion system F family protein [Synergistaceae bacterium]